MVEKCHFHRIGPDLPGVEPRTGCVLLYSYHDATVDVTGRADHHVCSPVGVEAMHSKTCSVQLQLMAMWPI